jgi:hypothetical protein
VIASSDLALPASYQQRRQCHSERAKNTYVYTGEYGDSSVAALAQNDSVRSPRWDTRKSRRPAEAAGLRYPLLAVATARFGAVVFSDCRIVD